MINKSLFSVSGKIALIIAVAMISASSAFAGGAFENALINLRSAHYLIDSQPNDWKKAPDETTAKNDINAAIGEIKKVGIDDGKSLKDHPLEYERITDRKSRLLKAIQLLKASEAELSKLEEPDPKKKQIKSSALLHIKQALASIDKLIPAAK